MPWLLLVWDFNMYCAWSYAVLCQAWNDVWAVKSKTVTWEVAFSSLVHELLLKTIQFISRVSEKVTFPGNSWSNFSNCSWTILSASKFGASSSFCFITSSLAVCLFMVYQPTPLWALRFHSMTPEAIPKHANKIERLHSDEDCLCLTMYVRLAEAENQIYPGLLCKSTCRWDMKARRSAQVLGANFSPDHHCLICTTRVPALVSSCSPTACGRYPHQYSSWVYCMV